MDNRTREFRDLTDWLGLPATEVGKIIDRSVVTVRQYRSSGARGRVPTEEVLTRLRDHRRSLLRGRLERAVADLRAAGMEVDIGWGPVLRRAAAQSFLAEELVAQHRGIA